VFNFIIVIGMLDIPKAPKFFIHSQKLDSILTSTLGHHFQSNNNAKQADKRDKSTQKGEREHRP
jgi:hypothetical protein